MNLGGKMDKLVEFLKNNDTLQCKKDNLILEEDIEKYEKKLNFNFGKELKKYILEYGFLAFKFVDSYSTFGIVLEKSTPFNFLSISSIVTSLSSTDLETESL